jgi:hypothetical protein
MEIYNAILNCKQQCSRQLAVSLSLGWSKKTLLTLKIGGKLLKNAGNHLLTGKAAYTKRLEPSQTLSEP